MSKTVIVEKKVGSFVGAVKKYACYGQESLGDRRRVRKKATFIPPSGGRANLGVARATYGCRCWHCREALARSRKSAEAVTKFKPSV
jgi:hypothetical protein